jgi:hypothetical protein
MGQGRKSQLSQHTGDFVRAGLRRPVVSGKVCGAVGRLFLGDVAQVAGQRAPPAAKSNWALPLDTPPFYGFAVTCGITFMFGGVRIDAAGHVLDRSGSPIAGLDVPGELVRGFFHNYPGGTGLMAGAVFGRRAGTSAAQRALALGIGRDVVLMVPFARICPSEAETDHVWKLAQGGTS